MKKPQKTKALRTGIAFSLAAHLVFASFMRAFPVEADQAERPTPAIVIHLVPPKPTPTPRPAPVHAPPKKTSRVARVMPRIHLVRAHSHGRNAVSAPINPAQSDTQPAAPIDTSTGAPEPGSPAPPATPTATPKPACSAPDVPAKAVDPVTPDEPQPARDEGVTGTAKIRVDLDETGRVVGASVFLSTGSQQLDQAALQAARETRYAPEETDCKDVSGSYLFTVQFQ